MDRNGIVGEEDKESSLALVSPFSRIVSNGSEDAEASTKCRRREKNVFSPGEAPTEKKTWKRNLGTDISV